MRCLYIADKPGTPNSLQLNRSTNQVQGPLELFNLGAHDEYSMKTSNCNLLAELANCPKESLNKFDKPPNQWKGEIGKNPYLVPRGTPNG